MQAPHLHAKRRACTTWLCRELAYNDITRSRGLGQDTGHSCVRSDCDATPHLDRRKCFEVHPPESLRHSRRCEKQCENVKCMSNWGPLGGTCGANSGHATSTRCYTWKYKVQQFASTPSRPHPKCPGRRSSSAVPCQRWLAHLNHVQCIAQGSCRFLCLSPCLVNRGHGHCLVVQGERRGCCASAWKPAYRLLQLPLM